MTASHTGKLRGLLTAFLAATAVATAAAMPTLASAEPRPASAANAGVGVPTSAVAAASPTAAPASPSAGGAGPGVPQTHRETLDDCMGYWDAQTHMSKSEWRAACERTLNGTEM